MGLFIGGLKPALRGGAADGLRVKPAMTAGMNWRPKKSVIPDAVAQDARNTTAHPGESRGPVKPKRRASPGISLHAGFPPSRE